MTLAPLATTFGRHLSDASREKLADRDLEPDLAELVRVATSAFPDLSVPLDSFLAFVAERTSPEQLAKDPARAIRDARAADLYLACACQLGDPAAIATFEQRYAHVIDAVVPRRTDKSRLVDEVRQSVHEKLFVPHDGVPGKISDYKGRGDLGGFLRVAAARTMLNLLRGEKRRTAAHDAHGRVPVPIDDPELARIEGLHRDDFRAALRDAAAELTTRERNLLSQHHIDGLTMDQLASLYGLHRVTVIRAIGAAREKLAEGTRKRLRERLRINQSELDSLLRVVASKLDLSIQRYLRGEQE